ncbi:MAG: hypothetical protein M3Y90_14860 [Actinomycetota bacterium]|nr:hypothetical protein [Actinomycetota bacterium]
MPDTTVTQPGWEIRDYRSADGLVGMHAFVGVHLAWAALELFTPIGEYRWQVFCCTDFSHPPALVRDAAAARAWLEHEADHALLATKVAAS